MKFFIAFTVLALIVIAQAELNDEQKAKIHVHHNKCQENPATRISDETYNKLRDHGIFDNSQLLKAHLLCYNQQVGYQDSNGELKLDVMREKLSKNGNDAKVNEIISKCAVKKNTPEQTAYDLIQCFGQNKVQVH